MASKTFSVKNVVWGRGSIDYLESIQGKRAIIITDKTLANLGTADRVADHLKKAVSEVKVFDEVEPEPSIDTVMKAVKENRDFDPDLIVGLGGGSCLDASKAVRVFLENPQLTYEEVRYMGGPPKTPIPPFKKTLAVAIPSTSGTASEVTAVAVITDPSVPIKSPLISPVLIPNTAILDPDISDSMPAAIAAQTGLDALTHALESYVCTQANNFSTGPAIRAIMLIMKYLPDSVLKSDPDAREQVHYAACLGGISFVHSGNGLAHSVSIQVGTAFKLSHGLATGIALPYTVKFNSSAAAEQYAEVSQCIGYKGNDNKEAVDYLIQRILELMKQTGVPTSYKEAGVPRDKFVNKLDDMAAKGLLYPTSLVNPRQPTMEEFVSLFNACYEGE